MLEAWNKDIPTGSKLFSLGKRLSAAKKACKILNREGFGNIQQKAKDAMVSLQEVQSKLLIDPTDSLFREEFIARKQWKFFEAAHQNFYERKSRIRWYRDGDANTRFFYKMVQTHQARNAIRYLRDELGNHIVNQAQIKDMVVSYFYQVLGTESQNLEIFTVTDAQNIVSYRCPSAIAAPLTVIPSTSDIRAAILSMPKSKAPGPDGFPAEFFWEAWEIVGQDLIDAVKEFFVSGRMLKKFNETVITLIPKTTGADCLSSFRPISLCTTVYKIIARILKQRLQLFIGDVVQRNQVGFVKGRLLCENVLLASELVVDFHKPGPVKRGCLKIDLSKAFDNVNWDFLFNLLTAFEVPNTLIDWLKECVTTTSFSVALNGELHGHFPGKKGLRQGDPISSLLFTMAMDVLSKMLDAGAANGLFSPHPDCLAPLVTHLSFADDVLIFFDGSENSLTGILNILDKFRAVSGLTLNRGKTEIMLDGGNLERCRLLAESTGLSQGSLPVRYLGVPLSSKKMKKSDFQPMLDKIGARFNSWTARHLSFAGRLQLIQAVIYSTIAFWASIFILPNQCVRSLEQMCNAYLWSGAPNSAKGAKVSWDSVCSPKSSGGLGLRRIAEWNKVLGLKLIWLIFAASGSLWVSWIRRNLIGNDNFWDLDCHRKGSWIWRRICKLRLLAHPMVICRIGSGITSSFWFDNWSDLGPLIEITGESGPLVSGLPRNAVVVDGLRNGVWWINQSRSRNPIIMLLKHCLPAPNLVFTSEEDDVYMWSPERGKPTLDFSSVNTWKVLHPPRETVHWHKQVWFKGRIPKHAFLTWIAARDRMVTRDRLRRWGLEVPASCLLCNMGAESRQHIFFDCSYSSEVWDFFSTRLHLTLPLLFEDKLRWLKGCSSDKNIILLTKLIFQACLYSIWKERNSRIHTGSAMQAHALIGDIKLLMLLRLDSLSRLQGLSSDGETLLRSWLANF